MTLASGFPGDEDALPIRADARVLGATLKAGETSTIDLAASRHGYLVPRDGRGRGQWRARRRPRRRRDQRRTASVTITALEDAEIVLVDAA